MAKRKREAFFDSNFLDDLQYWVDKDRKTASRILVLVQAILRDPFTGIGKPEPLKHVDSNYWSRRITQEHRDD